MFSARSAAVFALLLLIVCEGAADLTQRRVATAEHWQLAARFVAKNRQRHEPLLIAPHWVSPVARHYLGTTSGLADVGLSDVDTAATVLQLSVRGARHALVSAWGQPSEAHAFGAVTVERFRRQPERLVFSVLDSLARAEVSVGQAKNCTWRGSRHVCPGQGQWVGADLAEINFRPRRCVRAWPVASGILRIEFKTQILAQRLVGYTGIGNVYHRKWSKVPVSFAVKVDGQLIYSVEENGKAGWRRFEVSLPKAGAGHSLAFEIASDSIKHRSFCFVAEGRE